MLKRLRKLILLGVLSVSMLIPNTITFATEPEVSVASEVQDETQPDTPAPQPDTPASQPDTPAPQPDTPAPQPDTPAPQPDTPASQPDTPAPQPDTPASQPDTPASQPASSDTSGTETETQTPAQTEPQTVGTENQTQTESQDETETDGNTEIQKSDKKSDSEKKDGPEQDPTLHTTDGTDVTANIIGFSVDPSKYPAANVSENTVLIYQYLVSSMGLNHAGACGVLANIQLESNFNSLALGDGGSSYGICQWHNGRFNNLISFCNGNGLDYNTINGQLQYLSHELANNYPSVLSYVRSVPDTAQGAYDAAYYWCMHFEVPDHTAERAAQRGNLAKNEYFGKSFSSSPKEEKEVTAVQKVKTVRDQMDAKETLGDIRGQMNLENRLTNIRIKAMLNK